MPKTVKCITLYGKDKRVSIEKLIIRPAAYGIVVRDNKILLLTCKHTGKYWLPGGGLEKGEKLEDSLKREMIEETGAKIKNIEFCFFKEINFYYDPHKSAFQNLSFFYACESETDYLCADNEVDPNDEMEKPRWIGIETLKKEYCQPLLWGILSKISKLGFLGGIILEEDGEDTIKYLAVFIKTAMAVSRIKTTFQELKNSYFENNGEKDWEELWELGLKSEYVKYIQTLKNTYNKTLPKKFRLKIKVKLFSKKALKLT